jgi:hypothetical protein
MIPPNIGFLNLLTVRFDRRDIPSRATGGGAFNRDG